MFWIIISLAVLLAIGWTVWCICESEGIEIWGIGIIILVVITGLIIAIYAGIVTSIDWKYEEGKKVEVYELVSLRDEVASVGGGNWRYISIYAENSYTYYLETKVPESYGEGITYKSYTISGGNVFIMEDDKYIDNAKLVKYVSKPKNKFWTAVFVGDKVEYVFYVPEGSIVKSVSLN